MSSRADFYVGRGEDAIWLGSIALDGYPDQFLRPSNPEWREFMLLPASEQYDGRERPSAYLDMPFAENPIMVAATSDEFIAAALALIDGRDDGTPAANGWPWPWKDSSTSSFVYAFDDGQLYVSQSGGPWHRPQCGESCERWPIFETLCEAQSELRAEAQREARVQSTNQLVMTEQLAAAKAEVEQAQAAIEQLDCPTFPDMTTRQDVAWGAGSGLTVLSGPVATFGRSPHEA
jgi:hypothetical protein